MSAETKKTDAPAELQVSVTSAKDVLYQDRADFVVAPGKNGILGIGPNHTKVVALLKKGTIVITNGTKEKKIDITEGMLQVNRDSLDILISS